jgi:tetratricopeptide (TPR) repeat protein
MIYVWRTTFFTFVLWLFLWGPARADNSSAHFHATLEGLKRLSKTSSATARQDALVSLLQLYFWTKDNFSLQQEPEYEWIANFVRTAAVGASTVETTSLQAAYALLLHDYRQALALTARSSEPWHRLIAGLVGEPRVGNEQVWRISLVKSRQLYRDFAKSALAGSLLAEALLEAWDDSPQDESLLKEAARVLKDSRVLEPENLYLVYQQAQVDYLSGEREKADLSFQRLIARASESYLLAETVANFYVWMKEWQKARFAYEQALKYRSDRPRLYQKLENIFLSQQQPQNAIEMYIRGLERHPMEASFYGALKGLDIKGCEDFVTQLLAESVRKFPKNTYLWIYQGDVMQRLQRYAEARVAYEQAVLSGSGALVAYESLFQLLWQQKDISALELWLKQAQNHKGMLSVAHYWSGMILLQRQQPLLAIAEFEKASLKDHAVQYALMMAYRQSQQYPKARTLLQAMLKENPKDIQLLLTMGDLYFEERNFTKAEDYYLWADKLEPYQPDIYFSLGNLYAETQRLPMAIQAFERVILLRPEEPDARNNLGNAFLKQKRFQEALQTFEQILSVSPEYATAYYNLACAHALMGHKEQALQFLQQAIQRDQQFKSLAVEDPDFSGLRQDKNFLKLVQ